MGYQIANGDSIENIIKAYPEGKDCLNAYFDPDKMIKVVETNNGYQYQDDGAHRLFAAIEAGVTIPVKVVGEDKQIEKTTPKHPREKIKEKEIER